MNVPSVPCWPAVWREDQSFSSRVSASQKAQTASELEPPTIMIVDDSLTVRKITGRLLEREGYKVLTARDGVDAIEQLAEVKPDVMLVDIEMPRMDGFDLTRNVRGDARTRDIPIIMITSADDTLAARAREVGVSLLLVVVFMTQLLPAGVVASMGFQDAFDEALAAAQAAQA